VAARPEKRAEEECGHFAQNDNFKVKRARRKSAALKAAALRSNLLTTEPHGKDAERFFGCVAARPEKRAAEERGHFAQNDNFKVKRARRKSAALKAAGLRSNLLTTETRRLGVSSRAGGLGGCA